MNREMNFDGNNQPINDVTNSENDDNKLMDNLAESMEYLSRISPTTMPEWMD